MHSYQNMYNPSWFAPYQFKLPRIFHTPSIQKLHIFIIYLHTLLSLRLFFRKYQKHYSYIQTYTNNTLNPKSQIRYQFLKTSILSLNVIILMFCTTHVLNIILIRNLASFSTHEIPESNHITFSPSPCPAPPLPSVSPSPWILASP